MNLVKYNQVDSPMLSYRKIQMELVPFFVKTMLSYLKQNGSYIDFSSIVVRYEESSLSKSYKYSGVYHSTMELEVTYCKVNTISGVQELSSPKSLINTYIPKLEDNMFILNGCNYVPMLYLIDRPISYKKNSISFDSLFCSFVMTIDRNKVIIMDSFVSLSDFLRIFFTDNQIIDIFPNMQSELNITTRKESLLNILSGMKMKLLTREQLAIKINQMFFDGWTSELYKSMYGSECLNISDLIIYAIEYMNNNPKPSFIDLNHKRLTFIEQLLKPLFKGTSNIIKKINSGIITETSFVINNANNAITSFFSKEMHNATLFESSNTFTSLTLSKALYKTPGSNLKIPTEVSGIHETYRGIICPVSVSNSNSGEIVTFISMVQFDSRYGMIDIEKTRSQKNNPIISTGLSSVPFVSSTDSTRLQMACKQLNQALTHDNCERPYVIGEDHRLITIDTGIADEDGTVAYVDNRVMVVLYDKMNVLKQYPTPRYKHTKDKIVSKRRFILAKDVDFKKGELLFEYDSTKGGIVSYGYNLNVTFMPFFGFTCEDAIVISESAANKCRQRKSETILIPIFPFMTVHKLHSYSKYNIIPEIGESCDPSELLKISIINSSNVNQQLKAIVEPLKRDQYSIRKTLTNIEITIKSKLTDIVLEDVRVHTNTDTWKIDDISSKRIMDKLLKDKLGELYETAKDLRDIFGKYAGDILHRHHMWKNAKPSLISIDTSLKLQGVIELTVLNESNTQIGDKMSNRFANKGVVSLILPDELMPRQSNGIPVDYICNPMAVFNRMNYGQLTEGFVSKVIRKCEKDCLDNPEDTSNVLNKLAGLSDILDNPTYADKIRKLSKELDISGYEEFTADVYDGMFFESKSFVSLDMLKLTEYIKTEYNLDINEDIVIPKETFEYFFHRYELGYEVTEDVIIKDVFTAPIYVLKLKHLAQDKLTARDFGKYSPGTNSPSKSTGSDKASKIGSMEFDGLLGNSAIHTIREFRSVKASAIELKSDLIEQILDTGFYKLPDKIEIDSVQQTVESLIKAVSSKSS